MLAKLAVVAACCGVLAACSGRLPPEVLAPTPVAETPYAKTVHVYAATLRTRHPDKPYAFGPGRADALAFAAFDVSVPNARERGQLRWAKGAPDPRTDFMTTRQFILNQDSFVQGLDEKNVGLYVHGFNQTFQDAVFRAAQMGADARFAGKPVIFSWPSMGRVDEYLTDRDATDYARNALVDTLTMLVRDRPAGGRVTVLAHSMGARLTMEALRQLRLQGRDDILDRLEVILAAPDIDLDVFRMQLATLGPMREPLTLLIASDDRALAVSSILAGGNQRVGALNIHDPATQRLIGTSQLRVIDISSVKSDAMAHGRFMDMVALFPDLEQEGPQNPAEAVRNVGGFVFDSVGRTFQGIGGIVSGDALE